MARRQHLDPRWEYDMTAYVGKQLSHTFEVIDASSGDDTVIDLTGFTAAGKIVDEDGATVVTLTPTITAALGQIHIDQTLSAGLAPGRLDWKMVLIESGGEEHVRFFGKFNLKTY